MPGQRMISQYRSGTFRFEAADEQLCRRAHLDMVYLREENFGKNIKLSLNINQMADAVVLQLDDELIKTQVTEWARLSAGPAIVLDVSL